MRLTIVGSGDAFGSGGRFNTCFFLQTAKATLLVDFGATSLVALKARGIDPDRIDGIILSHLHGDHFGALPFLLLDAQFLAASSRAAPLPMISTPRRAHQACSPCGFTATGGEVAAPPPGLRVHNDLANLCSAYGAVAVL